MVIGIMLNSFTVQSSVKNTEEQLIWYFVDGSGHIDPNSPINPGDPVTKSDLPLEYSACGGELNICARGFLPNALPTAQDDEGEDVAMKDE